MRTPSGFVGVPPAGERGKFQLVLRFAPLHFRFPLRLTATRLILVVAMVAAVSGCSSSRPQVAAAAAPPPPIDFIGDWGVHGTDPGQLDKPVGLAVDGDSRVYVTEPEADFLQKFTITGVPLLTFEDHAVHNAAGIAIDSGGGIYVADARAGQIHVFFPEGDLLRSIAVAPQRASSGPFIFTVDAEGAIVVPDPAGGRVQIFGLKGALERAWRVPAGRDGKPAHPLAAVAGPDGFVYTGDAVTGRIAKFTRTGERMAEWGDAAGAAHILGLGVSQDHVFVLRDASPRLEVWTLDGMMELTDDLGGRLSATPARAAALALAPDGELLVLDAAAPHVLRFRVNLQAHSPPAK